MAREDASIARPNSPIVLSAPLHVPEADTRPVLRFQCGLAPEAHDAGGDGARVVVELEDGAGATVELGSIELRPAGDEEERRWVPDGRSHRVAFAGAELAISVRDTTGYIDINKADPRLLMGLLRRFAESEAKAGRLRDRILLARGTPPGAG